MSATNKLTLLVHGEAGAGKSWLTNTAPGPRLLIDAEGRAEYLADLRKDPTGMVLQEKVLWDPSRPIPEESANKDVLTVVDAFSMRDLAYVMRYLKSGKHPWRSVALDSITKIQFRHRESIAGTEQMQIQDWGRLLRDLQNWVGDLIDLRKHKTNPLLAITVVGGSQELNDMQRLMLQGQLATSIAYMFDVVGYMEKRIVPESGERERSLLIDGFVKDVVAKDNTHRLSMKYGDRIPNPDISAMLRVLNPKPTETESSPSA